MNCRQQPKRKPAVRSCRPKPQAKFWKHWQMKIDKKIITEDTKNVRKERGETFPLFLMFLSGSSLSLLYITVRFFTSFLRPHPSKAKLFFAQLST